MPPPPWPTNGCIQNKPPHLDVGSAVEDVEADEGVGDDEADAADAGAEFGPGPEVLQEADPGDGAPGHGDERSGVHREADHENTLSSRHQQEQHCNTQRLSVVHGWSMEIQPTNNGMSTNANQGIK